MQAVLCGYYGMGNGGDEALLWTLLSMLPSHVTPIVLSGDPAYTTATYGVTAYHRKDIRQVIKAFRQADAFIWGGGSLMQDATSLLNPLYYGGLMVLAQRLGLKTIAWGQGIGPLKRSPTRWITRHCLSHCTAVSVRDKKSFALVQSWNIAATLAPDPVWAMSDDRSEDRSQSPKSHIQSNTVAVVLRPHPLLTPARLDNLTQALVEFQNATQSHILLVPFQPVNDRAIATHIQSQLSGTSEIIEHTDPRQLHAVFSTVKLAIAMRLHGAIMAIAAGCQCWAISYDPKVTQLMTALDLPGWELEQLPNAQVIAQAWLDYYRHPPEQQGAALDQQKVLTLADQARLHQGILKAVLTPDKGNTD